MTDQDKLIELDRYDARAKSQLVKVDTIVETLFGSQTMPSYLQTPYIYYEQRIAELIRPDHLVLELGAGVGLHTRVLLNTGAQITASDISPSCLSLLMQKFKNANGNLNTRVADMESLPFEDASFDVIACAGSLSYGAPTLVDTEIRRVLRPGGMLICVDSLNHNPIYRANRWLHYIRGNRSKSTLKRMPNLSRIRALSEGFSSVSVRFFGAMSYAMPGIARLFGENTARTTSDMIDQLIGVRRSAFKFVIVAKGFA
jgi:ubiquinone/menaquinone biosynthesis C-methylase UbiE